MVCDSSVLANELGELLHPTVPTEAYNAFNRSRARPNGATQTFRRSSTATSLSQQRDGNQITNSPQSSGGNVYVPPHLNANFQSYGRNGSSADTRYSKDQLLDLFRSQAKAGSFNNNVNDLLLDGWSPTPNGTNNSGWGRKDDHKESTGPEICWDHSGSVQPISLSEMTVEEKEVSRFCPEEPFQSLITTTGFCNVCQLPTQAPYPKFQ